MQWFKEHTGKSNNPKLLLFNTTGDRNTEQMLDMLHSRITFDMALFAPNVAANSIELQGNYLFQSFLYRYIFTIIIPI